MTQKDMTYKIAYTSEHFGKAESFIIVELNENFYRVTETREVPAGCRDCGAHDDGAISVVIDRLSDCAAIIAARIGERVKSELSIKNIQALEFDGDFKKALSGYMRHISRIQARKLAKPLELSETENAPAYLTDSIQTREQKEKNHPCFDDGAHGRYGRIHLPVSAKCNIKCRFCERDFNEYEVRPGVSSGILSPELAVETVARAIELEPKISVIGIAGPGEPLADDSAVITFELLKNKFPKLKFCLSTNGYSLPNYVRRLYGAGVRHLTVTVNAATAGTLEKIVAGVNAEELLKNQLNGIKKAAELGFEIKINTVFIPSINGGEIARISETMAKIGAKRHNVMPLIPNGEFSEFPAPNCDQLNEARKLSELFLPVFRHCAHCRADACGIPGISDVSGELYAQNADFRCGNKCGG